MRLLRFLPTAAHLINGDELPVDKLLGLLGQHLRVARSVEVPAGDVLGLWSVPEAEILRGKFPSAMLVDKFVDHCDRRLCKDGETWHHNLNLVLAELVLRQKGLVLPG